jgi:hypothetical protein
LCERDLEEAKAAVEALSFSANPDIQLAIQPFLDGTTASLKRFAADLLYRRGELSVSQIESLLRSQDSQLLATALHASAGVPSWTGDVSQFLHHDSDRVVYAALSVCHVRRYSAGRQRALELVGKGKVDLGDPIFWLGAAGDLRDWPVLESLLSGATQKRAATALGYWGYPVAIPALLRTLAGAPAGRHAVIVFALERITGAGLSGWELQSQELALAAPSKYEDWLGEHASLLNPDKRLRRGREFGPDALLCELEDRAHSEIERTIAHLELMSLYRGTCPRFRADGFIATQENMLLEWKRLWKIA